MSVHKINDNILLETELAEDEKIQLIYLNSYMSNDSFVRWVVVSGRIRKHNNKMINT